ncbi:MAG: nicotinate-nucleotide adenylyltransferase [Chloroflexi bacterium]|nr:nicotinate-nucleotide adenylyltransferase [Chloroflexota bacterium]
MRLGILGGTFDPVHIGHLLVAEEARTRLGLEEVLFIPTGRPWLRAGEPISLGRDRLAMVGLAIDSNPFFRASDMELRRPGDTYTVDTLRALHAEYGGRRELYFILGMDTFEQLPRWREPDAILQLCHLVVVSRPGHGSAAVERVADRLGARLRERTVVIEGLEVGISGTDIRRRVAAGQSIRYRVPEPVRRYIAARGLYKRVEGLS